MVPKSIQNWTRTAQKTRKKKDRNIKPNTSHPAAAFTKKSPSWVQVGSQNGAKIKKTRVKKSMHFLIHARSHLGTDFHGFWNREWSQVGTKVARKSMMNRKVVKRTNNGKTNTKISFGDVRATIFDTKLVEKSIEK